MIRQLKDIIVARLYLRKSEKMSYKDLKPSLMAYNGRNEKLHGIHFVNGKMYEVSAQYDFDRGMVRALVKDIRQSIFEKLLNPSPIVEVYYSNWETFGEIWKVDM